ncbi:hypothetical protein [Kitasatospora sp. NPDC127116]|uniref:hypothetical protein n=1 Tax=Kitasatospora sp. NPDC127116 TaxID=3345367 RepID=UPI003631065C
MTEHTPRPGRTWETALARAEIVVPDDAPDPRSNRAARRALKRQQRKTRNR